MKQILLAEDSTRIASFISKGLAAQGYSVSHVADGAAVVPAINTGSFDLLVLDIGLPNKDGLSILEELRGTGNEIPVLVLTALDSVDATLASFQGGADDFMSKPFSFDELLARIERRIRTTIPNSFVSASSALSAGSITLDLLTRHVFSNGQEIELTAREFKMLELFIINADQILSREQLLSRVWGLDHDPESNVVDVYIRYLRQKLGFESIETVRGRGYRLRTK